MTSIHATINLTFDQPVTVYALVIGGWYPLAFAPNCVLILDRSILGILHQIDNASSRNDLEANKWWLDFINQESHTINPVLCALESNKKSVPTMDEFTALFQDACIKINKYLPRAKMISYTAAHFKAAYETISHLSERYELESEFLISTAPIISHRRKDSDLEDAYIEILEQCKKYNLNKNSLVVVAVLSCLYERKDGAEPLIGRKIINPTDSYTQENAHNAISDLRALEMLAATNGLNTGCASFCTRDKHLAAMWCGLQVSKPEWSEDHFTCSIRPNSTLFPRLSEEEINALVTDLSTT